MLRRIVCSVLHGAFAAGSRTRARPKLRSKRWGELANKMGTVVEDIVAPSVRRLAREVFECGDLVYIAAIGWPRPT